MKKFTLLFPPTKKALTKIIRKCLIIKVNPQGIELRTYCLKGKVMIFGNDLFIII